VSDEAGTPVEHLKHDRPNRAGTWMLISRVAAQLSQISLFLIAARFLSPAEFGVFALVQAVSAFLFVGAAAGWRETIISTTNSAQEIEQVMAFSIASGMIMALIGGFISLGLEFAGAIDAAALAAAFCVCLLVAPIVSAFNGMLVRLDRIKTFAIASVVAEIAGFASATAALFSGFGVLALVLGKIVFLALICVLLAFRSNWSGKLAWRGARTRLLLSTSWHILLNRTIFSLQSNSSTFMVGAFLGPVGVGLYRAAERVVSSVAELVMEPLRVIAWIELRRAADQADKTGTDRHLKLANAASGLLPLFVMLTAPIFIGLAFVAHELVIFALGPTWAASGSVAMVLSISALSVVPTVLTEPLLSLLGEVRRLPKYLLLNALVGAGCMLASGPFGLYALALSGIPSGLFLLGTTVWILRRHGHFAWKGALIGSGVAVPPLLVMIAFVFLVQWLSREMSLALPISLALQVASGAVAYVGVLHLLKPDIILAIRRM
jgi:O-antigen/teichoic acid export membrane protein